MNLPLFLYPLSLAAALFLLRKVQVRLRLSRAKHPSLQGHVKWARRLAKLIRFYEYGETHFFSSDGAPQDVVQRRRAGFGRLSNAFHQRAPKSNAFTEEVEASISDVLFTNAYRVPFQYRSYVRENLPISTATTASTGTRVKDLDDNWAYDLTGSYGVNLLGYDFYKGCIDRGIERARELGPVLGFYHPLIVDNVRKLKDISGLDEVSFHMSGTEAVMQAVRLARYHTGRKYLVRFAGAYHGWWDGVQPAGHQRDFNDVYTLKEMSEATLKVLRTRKDIACVLVNPLQALHPNSNAPSDATLLASDRSAHFDRRRYADWLRQLREVCTDRSIVLIFDEVFVGFRLAYRGAQTYFGVDADIVTYGKTLGGGLPVGAVCGKHDFMKRFRDDRPAQVCFARGTFNSHPYVMGAMNEFLRRLEEPETRRLLDDGDRLWNDRVEILNTRLKEKDLPVRIANLISIWTIVYTVPGRYNWMFQYYLRSEGLAISWVGSGRIVMSHDYSDDDYEAVMERFVRAAEAMKTDGWWWHGERLTNKAIKWQILRETLAAVWPGWNNTYESKMKS